MSYKDDEALAFRCRGFALFYDRIMCGYSIKGTNMYDLNSSIFTRHYIIVDKNQIPP